VLAYLDAFVPAFGLLALGATVLLVRPIDGVQAVTWLAAVGLGSRAASGHLPALPQCMPCLHAAMRL